MNQRIVSLKTTRYLNGRDKQGNPINEVIEIKLPYPSAAWTNQMKHIKNTGLNEVEILKVTESKDGKSFEVIETPKEIQAELIKAWEAEKLALTPDQQRIADLEAKIDALMNAKKGEPIGEGGTNQNTISGTINQDGGTITDVPLEASRAEYKEKFGKLPHHSWSVEQINEKIKEFQNS